MKSIVMNRHGRLVLPSHFFPEIDFSALDSVERVEELVKRDFDAKAPSACNILERIAAGSYETRYDLLRDLGLHLFWVNRYSITMYEKRPTAWRNVPKRRTDVFMPIVSAWKNGDRKIAAVQAEYNRLTPTWNADAEHRIFTQLFEIFSTRRHEAAELPIIKPTVAEILEDPTHQTFHLGLYDPDFPVYSYEDIVNCREDVPELEALMRWTMVLHNQYPWHRQHTRLIEVGKLRDDDIVLLFYPRNREVLRFIQRAKSGRTAPRASTPAPPTQKTARTLPPVNVRKQYAIWPRLQSIAVVKGEIECTNEDLVRNSAYNWSPMSADEITRKTGIACRRYTERSLGEIALEATRSALEHARLSPADVGAVIFCTCTSTQLIPSMATWISGQLGMYQTRASFDLVAACAGMVYGLAECVRILQEVNRPVVLVCGEKFSDKIGCVRPSRMIFGDGAAAMVLAPAAHGEAPDIELLQTYASGPYSEVNSIIWPNPDFDNSITVYGPEVESLVRRYLSQMMEELQATADPNGETHPLLDSIDLIVPHQANRTMVTKLATGVGLPPHKLYFNIASVGNTSAASIPIAIADAVAEGVVGRPSRIFAPGFGAGAVAGYAVMRVDPAIVATGLRLDALTASSSVARSAPLRERVPEAYAM